MIAISWAKIRAGFILAGISLTAAGCQESGAPAVKPQAAVVTTFADLSASTAFVASPAYADAAIKQVGKAVMKQQLGDAFRVVPIGSRSVERAVDALSVSTDRKFRLAAARKRVEASLNELIESGRQNGGDGTTNILYTLENAQPRCTPRSKIIVLSDGIEDSEGYSVNQALALGKPVRLPPPSHPYLKGCSIEFVGIGITPQAMNGMTAETLPNDKLQALIGAWREYFAAAGVSPGDMNFTSIL